ncbi:MAG TPA: transcription termination/antitermination NusG family protein [Thermoanaerobaculia bacterium]|jgi:transcription antitermination factor NusG|nr:transcription termination/antitermination NusG family protein [Thermoanaerobaculia bacterium]
MPLLPRALEMYPEDVFALAFETSPWYVAHVRSRHEKALARYLAEKRIPFYLPQIPKRTARRGRSSGDRVSYIPLFAGYVFFRGGRASCAVALRSDVIANLIEVQDQQLLGDQLQQVRRLQEAGASFVVQDDLAPGDPVRIASGPFAGYTGVVIRHGRAERLVIEVSFLRKRAAVEFDPAALRRARA